MFCQSMPQSNESRICLVLNRFRGGGCLWITEVISPLLGMMAGSVPKKGMEISVSQPTSLMA